MEPTSGGLLTSDYLQEEFAALGVRQGATMIVHSSLSAFGWVEGGATTVVNALRGCLRESGTIVVPAETPEVCDPFPEVRARDNPDVVAARSQVPVFHDALPTSAGAIPRAVLAHPGRLRSSHPQVSVAALGPRAREITKRQLLGYAFGKESPFEQMYKLGADILLLGVGHDRNTFLHHAESFVPHHRRKLRRFPYIVDQQRVWVEVGDVGDDNGTYFPQIGEEFGATEQIRKRTIGEAHCQLINSVPLIDFAKKRLTGLLPRCFMTVIC